MKILEYLNSIDKAIKSISNSITGDKSEIIENAGINGLGALQSSKSKNNLINCSNSILEKVDKDTRYIPVHIERFKTSEQYASEIHSLFRKIDTIESKRDGDIVTISIKNRVYKLKCIISLNDINSIYEDDIVIFGYLNNIPLDTKYKIVNRDNINEINCAIMSGIKGVPYIKFDNNVTQELCSFLNNFNREKRYEKE